VTNQAELIEIICEKVRSHAVADRIREIAKTRTNLDPSYWANVMLRESWREEHGSYDEWDRVAKAGGVDPTQFGEAT
jgi:hypothetical protein